jgi:hypothetical protein
VLVLRFVGTTTGLAGMLTGRFVWCVITGTVIASCRDDGSEDRSGANDLVVGSVLDGDVDFDF